VIYFTECYRLPFAESNRKMDFTISLEVFDPTTEIIYTDMFPSKKTPVHSNWGTMVRNFFTT
jgi:hypothetical protein